MAEGGTEGKEFRGSEPQEGAEPANEPRGGNAGWRQSKCVSRTTRSSIDWIQAAVDSAPESGLGLLPAAVPARLRAEPAAGIADPAAYYLVLG